MNHIIITHTISQGYIPAYTNEDGSPLLFENESDAMEKITDSMFKYNTERMNEGDFESLMTESDDFCVNVEEAEKEYGIKLETK
tara:strand:- start:563 stop:814 length:252 start_codon:yes stop_codon:yes gene_type:complete